jgi:hypothetical protein
MLVQRGGGGGHTTDSGGARCEVSTHPLTQLCLYSEHVEHTHHDLCVPRTFLCEHALERVSAQNIQFARLLRHNPLRLAQLQHCLCVGWILAQTSPELVQILFGAVYALRPCSGGSDGVSVRGELTSGRLTAAGVADGLAHATRGGAAAHQR